MSLRLENVSVVYGEGTPFRKVALDNVNIEFPKGKIPELSVTREAENPRWHSF